MKVIRFLDEYFEQYLLVVILSAMCILIGIQIGFRYFFNLPLAWTEEIARYLFIWLIYISASLAVKRGRHLKVDAVMLLFKEKGQFVLKMISNILFIIFCVIMVFYSYKIAYSVQFVRYQESPAVRLPMIYAYASVFMGFLLMLIRLVQDTILLIMKKNSSEELNNITEGGK